MHVKCINRARGFLHGGRVRIESLLQSQRNKQGKMIKIFSTRVGKYTRAREFRSSKRLERLAKWILIVRFVSEKLEAIVR